MWHPETQPWDRAIPWDGRLLLSSNDPATPMCQCHDAPCCKAVLVYFRKARKQGFKEPSQDHH